MESSKLVEIVNDNIDDEDVRKDFEVLHNVINSNNISTDELIHYLMSIKKNIAFFRKELGYSLQLSNLIHFELDARNNTYRGSKYRYDLIDKYKFLIK